MDDAMSEIDTSRETVEKYCHAAPFADNSAGIPEMVEMMRALLARAEAAEAQPRWAWNAALREAVAELHVQGEGQAVAAIEALITAPAPDPMQDAAEVLDWVTGTYTTTDDDNGPREGMPRKLFAWRAAGFTIIYQGGRDGLFLLKTANGKNQSAWPSLKKAKGAAIRALSGGDTIPAPDPVRNAGNDYMSLRMMPPECAPNGVPVLIAGGIAIRKTGGEWYSVMCDRPLNWKPSWWAAIPKGNLALSGADQ